MINRLKKDKPQINVIIFHILFNIEIYFLRSILTFFNSISSISRYNRINCWGILKNFS